MGYVYYEWNYEVMYTENKLKKSHRHFYHHRSSRILDIVKRSDNPTETKETLDMLQKITDSCYTFQRNASQPGRFRVALPSMTVVFNRTFLMDLMYLDGAKVLKIVCKGTLFSADVFLVGESANGVWNYYMDHWVTKYVSLSKPIRTDRGQKFYSDRRRYLLQTARIQCFDSGIESHKYLGVGEKYH